ncbi:MAG: transketolase-like TK C-terminal-containing protein, partial [Gemmatimonadaceae bacterium]
RLGSAAKTVRGGYILQDAEDSAPELILMGSGSEVHILLAAAEKLFAHEIRVRVVSMPSLDVFARQPRAYRDEVLPPGIKHRIAMEAASPLSWYRWVGDAGEVIGLDHFGASAPYERLYQEFGITAEHVVARAREMLDR